MYQRATRFSWFRNGICLHRNNPLPWKLDITTTLETMLTTSWLTSGLSEKERTQFITYISSLNIIYYLQTITLIKQTRRIKSYN